MQDSATRVVTRTCPLCEANCGLELTLRDDVVVRVRGDEQDVLSHGYICPKGPAVRDLHEDPDRLRTPLIRDERAPNGFREVSWDEAFAEIERRLTPLLATHGRDAVGVYLGNPSAHHLGLLLYGRVLLRALGSHRVFSASTVDQMPKQVSAGLMFGAALTIPIADVDRTDFLLILGANPLVSNGSLLTAPNMKARLRAIRARGGKVVVVDPRRTRTAEEADEHLAIRPGTDALFLFALAHVIIDEGLARPGRLADLARGEGEVAELARTFSPEAVARACGIAADTIRRIARALAASPRAAVYGRIGTCVQEFGTLSSWLVDVLNYLTGNLDREGGAMFPAPAAGSPNTAGTPGRGRGVRFGRFASSVRGLPEVFGEIPAACIAEEITSPSQGRMRGLITVAGNPVLSTPDGAGLARALGSLDLMVSIDIYRNETTRHAHVVLPGLSPLEQSHYPVAFSSLSIRNFAKYSAPVLPPEGRPAEWEILLRLAAIAGGQGATADLGALDDFVLEQQLAAVVKDGSSLHGRDVDELRAALAERRGPERLLDLMLQAGPYGAEFGQRPDGLSLAKLEANPHGIDLGPLRPRLPEALRTPSGKIELAPPALVSDVARLRSALERESIVAADSRSLVLIGRRDLRSNNSWMHNVAQLVAGKVRCTVQVHPEDAARLSLTNDSRARVRSRVGEIELPVEIVAGIRPGVVSIPHGWGHGGEGVTLSVAAAHPGASSNDLADPQRLDPLSGNAVLSGIPVTITAV